MKPKMEIVRGDMPPRTTELIDKEIEEVDAKLQQAETAEEAKTLQNKIAALYEEWRAVYEKEIEAQKNRNAMRLDTDDTTK